MSAHKALYRKNVKVAEHKGAGAWLAERLSSLVLVPLILWALWSAAMIAGTGYQGALDWFAQPLNAWVLAATWLVTLWHANMGITVIVEDYIHKRSTLGLLLGLNALVCLGLAAVGLLFITRLATGSDPLPAGFGVW
ncbi:succinate dehydrogenase, hydrophobic membrane anchor protein [Brevundimonas poindexterae]|uniref:succinate dehydrogenase, hydrophobic membrane anchor protein n=1 Tax=Brevundimonas poindexterae TaxID=74325 RepID=UPI001CFC6139|nr:succinate dehydrogenase, hydrophobic membrane anchor protein [Brevundimonas poindexterae]